MDNYSSLKGTRVLVVEDDALQAEIAEGTLAELGCVVTGSAASVEAALVAIDKVDTFDCVVGRSSRARNCGGCRG
jgi:CheY-like chemotaxis protein